MPRYDYVCHHCGANFEARQSVEARDAAPCPACVHLARRRFLPTPYIQVPDHFKVMQSDFLPDPSDTAAWEARQRGDQRHAPRQPRVKEAFEAIKQWE
jgi:putative FmdB family regulatory protein